MLIITAIFRSNGNKHQDIGKRFLGGHPVPFYLFRELCRSRSHPVLGEHRVHIRIRTDFKRGLDGHGAVVGVGGFHVDHVVDAVDLLLQRRGHGLFHADGISACIGGAHFHNGGGNVGVLFYGQRFQKYDPHNHRHNGDHHGHNGPSDKKITLVCLACLVCLFGLL